LKFEAVSAIIGAICLLSVVLLPFLVMPAVAGSSTTYVDARNVNDPVQDGTAAHPFGMIQKGLTRRVLETLSRLPPECITRVWT
jgi:hypothetical protein